MFGEVSDLLALSHMLFFNTLMKGVTRAGMHDGQDDSNVRKEGSYLEYMC
jgi:hypothetical protein